MAYASPVDRMPTSKTLVDRFLGTQVAKMAFREARTAGELDPNWVKGIRLWVKKTFAPRTFDPHAPHDVLDHLKRLRDVELEKFYGHLFYSHGLLQHADGGLKSVIDQLRDKVTEELGKAREVLTDAIDGVRFMVDATTPGTREHEHRPDIREFYANKPGGEDHLKAERYLVDGLTEQANNAAEKVDAILSGRLLRFITAWLTKWAAGMPFETDELLLEHNIGGMKLVFEGKFSPVGADPGKDIRSPRDLKNYIPHLIKAKALLERRGLGFLWYGAVFVTCKECGGQNQYGTELGVGGHYLPNKDTIYIYSDPGNGITELMIHETGHRLYYRWLNAVDRANFDRYYGEVAAVSSYGAKASAEDFAEVFAHFVMGEDMTRDQIDRFKAFLGGIGKKLKLASPIKVSRKDLVGHLSVIAKAWRSDYAKFRKAAYDLLSAGKRDAPYLGRCLGEFVTEFTQEPDGGSKTERLIKDAFKESVATYGPVDDQERSSSVADRFLQAAGYETKDHEPIEFKVTPDNEGDNNRGWQVDKVEAFLGGKPVGYLNMSYIPVERFKRYYPSILEYLGEINGIGAFTKYSKYKDLSDLRTRVRALLDYHDRYPGAGGVGLTGPEDPKIDDLSVTELKSLRKDLEAPLVEKYGRGFKAFKAFMVDKPIVDFIRVGDEYQRRGVATALYDYGAHYLSQKGMKLYASGLQSKEAQAAWDFLRKTKGANIGTEKGPYGKTRTFLSY